MALHYIEAANRKRLAAEAMEKLNGGTNRLPEKWEKRKDIKEIFWRWWER